MMSGEPIEKIKALNVAFATILKPKGALMA